jgi:hypothetical protein
MRGVLTRSPIAVSSLGGFRTPAARACRTVHQGPASENLHKVRRPPALAALSIRGRHPKTFTKPEILKASKSCPQCIESGHHNGRPTATVEDELSVDQSADPSCWCSVRPIKNLVALFEGMATAVAREGNVRSECLHHAKLDLHHSSLVAEIALNAQLRCYLYVACLLDRRP